MASQLSIDLFRHTELTPPFPTMGELSSAMIDGTYENLLVLKGM